MPEQLGYLWFHAYFNSLPEHVFFNTLLATSLTNIIDCNYRTHNRYGYRNHPLTVLLAGARRPADVRRAQGGRGGHSQVRDPDDNF